MVVRHGVMLVGPTGGPTANLDLILTDSAVRWVPTPPLKNSDQFSGT